MSKWIIEWIIILFVWVVLMYSNFTQEFPANEIMVVITIALLAKAGLDFKDGDK